MVDVVLYVEGGGDGRLLHDQCRKGFRLFLEGAGLKGRMPRIVACGGREQAYDRFCMKVEEAEKHKNCIPILLIDSECAIDPKYETGDHEDWKPCTHTTLILNHIPCGNGVQSRKSWVGAKRQATPRRAIRACCRRM